MLLASSNQRYAGDEVFERAGTKFPEWNTRSNAVDFTASKWKWTPLANRSRNLALILLTAVSATK
jgi:hypothetical protein